MDLDDYYHKKSKEEGLNFYKSFDGEYYVELGRYIEKVSSWSVKEDQLLKNKHAIDKEKIVRLRDLEIEEEFTVNHLTPSKRLVRMDGLITVNDSIKRFTKELSPESFRRWNDFCLLMLTVLPMEIQKRVEKNLRKDLKVMEKNIESNHCMIDKLKGEINKLEKESYKKEKMMKKQEKKLDRLREENEEKDKRITKLEKESRKQEQLTKKQGEKLAEEIEKINEQFKMYKINQL